MAAVVGSIKGEMIILRLVKGGWLTTASFGFPLQRTVWAVRASRAGLWLLFQPSLTLQSQAGQLGSWPHLSRHERPSTYPAYFLSKKLSCVSLLPGLSPICD